MGKSGQIKAWAQEIGFDKVGIAKTGPAPEGERLQQWLDRGCHGEMKWMANNVDRRLDPRRVLPEARSIICLAVNYYTAVERGPDDLKISRYALVTDYHDVLGRMLKELTHRIEDTWPDSRNYRNVDTGPILEKAWAQQAGLGWIGKNKLLISRDYGSWLFLGEVVTTLELEADTPGEDHCGTCTDCIEACPTGALNEPHFLEARRCISYWTIETDGSIPPDIAGGLDGRVFGCDACQEACPFNRFQQEIKPGGNFAPRPEILPAKRWRDLDEAGFAEMTKDTPIWRRGLAGMRRNLQAAGISP